MDKRRKWSQADIEYLEEKWGYVSIDRIASTLNRTKTAIQIKAKRLKLGGAREAGEFLTACKASKLLGVERHVIIDYWIPKGLKAKKQNRTGDAFMWYIKISDLSKWLKNNQDKWDSRRMELFALGEEPEWLIEKRERDRSLPRIRFAKYTKEEDSIIKSMHNLGFTYIQIAERINRSSGSVERRLSRIK